MYMLILSGALAASSQFGLGVGEETVARLGDVLRKGGDTSFVSTCPDTGSSLRGSISPITCACPAIEREMLGTSVWGNEVYTDDSNICLAAIHDGRVSLSGGRITVWPAPGRAIYNSATRNGITSIAYRDFEGSIRFTPPPPPYKRKR